METTATIAGFRVARAKRIIIFQNKRRGRWEPFLAIPFVIVIGVLMVFFPVPLAIVYGSLVLLNFVYFRLTKRWIMQEILAEHPSLRPEQIRLVEKTPIFFKYVSRKVPCCFWGIYSAKIPDKCWGFRKL